MILSLKIFPALLAATLFIPVMAEGPAEVPRALKSQGAQLQRER